MVVSFTGTRKGMSYAQGRQLVAVLKWLAQAYAAGGPRAGGLEFHHGGAEGADRTAAIMARAAGYFVHWHPSPGVAKLDVFSTDPGCEDDTWHEVFPPLKRDKIMAKLCDVLVATPLTDQEEVRSGTWATVRYGRAAGKPIVMLSRGEPK